MNDTNGNNAEIENVEAVAVALAEWWHASARDLPWRFGRATPWGVLVSEVMSQQTQMSVWCRIGTIGWSVGLMRLRLQVLRNLM